MNALALPPDIAARVRRDEPMSKHTSWHVGGPADLFFRPLDVADLAAFLRSLEPDTPVMWIGLGSNLLVRDGGIRGAVIETHGVFDELERRSDTEIWCGSGVACAKLAKQCIKWGLGPAEFFAGIPGTLGGALAMNAGAFGGETWRHVLGVATIDRAGVRRERPASDYVASYRHVSGPANEWFLGARLTLRAASRREQRRHPPAARAPQGDAADRRMVVRLGVHESAGRSRGAPDRHAPASRDIASAARASRRCTRTSSSTTAPPARRTSSS